MLGVREHDQSKTAPPPALGHLVEDGRASKGLLDRESVQSYENIPMQWGLTLLFWPASNLEVLTGIYFLCVKLGNSGLLPVD